MCLKRVEPWHGISEEFFLKIYSREKLTPEVPVFVSPRFSAFTGIGLEGLEMEDYVLGTDLQYWGPPTFIRADSGEYYRAGIHAFTRAGFKRVIDENLEDDLVLILYNPSPIDSYTDGEQIVSKSFGIAGYFIWGKDQVEVPPAVHFYKILTGKDNPIFLRGNAFRFFAAPWGKIVGDVWTLTRITVEGFSYMGSLLREEMPLSPAEIEKLVNPFLGKIKQ